MKDLVTIVYEGIEDTVNKYIGDPKSDGQISVVHIIDELVKLGIDLDKALTVFNNRHNKKFHKYDMVNSLYLEWYCTSYPYSEWLEDNTKGNLNKAISILENMIEELVAIQETHEKIDGNYSEVEDKIETLREAICRIEKEEE